jgi:PTH1 family peptidyl-tRNA hydrolase|tara:strand:- start:7746 stop:8366 length:621 start_codon:yes stop_codon:yes gene_type:complete
MFNWIFRNKRPSNNTAEMSKKYLIVGLGNIGADYINTRHNIGFKVVETLAQSNGAAFETKKLGAMASFRFKGRTFILLKPTTFMNLSGKAVKYWLDKESIPQENLLIITDDLNLPYGSLRLKMKGSDGGHNGLKDIQDKLNTTHYNRLRFGISDEFSKGRQVDYVLGVWTEEESEQLGERLERCEAFVKSFVMTGVKNAMNSYNNS